MPEKYDAPEVENMVKAMEVYHDRHPSQHLMPNVPDKTPFQKVITHWITIAISAAAICGGIISGIVIGIDVKRNSDKVPFLAQEFSTFGENLNSDLDRLTVRLMDVDRLTSEAKDHRHNSEIHMSKEEKKLLFIEASKPLQDSINQVERSIDVLTIEHREAIKRQEKMAVTLEKLLNK